MRRPPLCLCVTALIAIASLQVAFAQDSPKNKKKADRQKAAAAKKAGQPKTADRTKAAVTNAAEADADFAYQGEYAGVAFLPDFGQMQVGLHVVALGDGKFDAVLYRGGLPGDGWDRKTKGTYSGAVAGNDVVFFAPRHKIVVESGGHYANVLGESDERLGRLIKKNRVSATLRAAPPPGAVVLFDGQNTDQLTGAKLTDDGLLKGGVLTKMPVKDFHLHLEFRTPYMPHARGQGRGNSGVYIQQRYEVQILDSFGLEGVENECGGLYKQKRADINMCLPPLSWQTYDIYFTAARYAEDRKTKVIPARITVLHNGVPVHYHREITAKTGGGKVEGPELFPINLQDHGNPVTFRNIWIVPGQGDESFHGFAGYPYYSMGGGYGPCSPPYYVRRCR